VARNTQGKPVGKGDDGFHLHTGAYMVLGRDRSLMFDTGHPEQWATVEPAVDALLEGRTLDWIVPSHPELPHAGNLERLLTKYPTSRVVGDVRDYHLYYPRFTDRLDNAHTGTSLDLGGGHEFVLVDALIKDLPNSVWGYEVSQRVLFVADGFAYTHHPPTWVAGGVPHQPGECWLTSDELSVTPTVEQAAYITRFALQWTRYVDFEPVFVDIDSLLATRQTNIIAPAHGNVIMEPTKLLPVVREAHLLAYAAAIGSRRSAG
jgi:flavorubredoxin